MKLRYNTSDTYSYMKMAVSQIRNIVKAESGNLNSFNYLPIKVKGKKLYYPVPKVTIDTMFTDCEIEITL